VLMLDNTLGNWQATNLHYESAAQSKAEVDDIFKALARCVCVCARARVCVCVCV
jgi:hypothetical protein